jgi:hypothetical protein
MDTKQLSEKGGGLSKLVLFGLIGHISACRAMAADIFHAANQLKYLL